MSNMDFEVLLSRHNANLKRQYDDAEEFSNWMPDDGDYTVSVVKCSKGVSTKKDPDNPMFWWKPVVRIEAGDGGPEILGQEFALGFFNTNAPGIMKGQARALNGGELVSFDDINAVFIQSIGKILRVKVVTTKSPKNGQDYTNCYIQEVIQVEAVEDLPDEPPQVDDGGGPVQGTEEATKSAGEVLA